LEKRTATPADLALKLSVEPFDSALLSAPGAWEAIVAAALREGLSGLLASRIRPYVSGERLKWCDRVIARNWARHTLNFENLKAVSSLLERARIPHLALKGPVLASRHYSAPFLRKPSVDLDLAVRLADLAEACRVLEADGYVAAATVAEARALSHHLVLNHASKPRLELHFRLSNGVRGISIDEFLERGGRHSFSDGFSIGVLDPADEILHLALHVVQDRFGTLFHLCETEMVWAAADPGVQDEAVRRGAAYRFSGALALADAAAQSCFGRSMLSSRVPLKGTWLSPLVNERLFYRMRKAAMRVSERTVRGRLRGRWLDLQVTDGPREALKQLTGMICVAHRSILGQHYQ
jgi:hypothetical protein